MPLVGPEDTLCWMSSSNGTALSLSQPRPHLLFFCSFYVVREKQIRGP